MAATRERAPAATAPAAPASVSVAAGYLLVDVNENEECRGAEATLAAAGPLKCPVTLKEADDGGGGGAGGMLDLAQRCLRGLNGSSELEEGTTPFPASCPGACGARVTNPETCRCSEPRAAPVANGRSEEETVKTAKTAKTTPKAVNGGCRAVPEVPDESGDGGGSAGRAASSAGASSSSELSEDVSPSDEDGAAPARLARPKTLSTEPNRGVSLSCEATPAELDHSSPGLFEGGRRQSAPEADLRARPNCEETAVVSKRSLFPRRSKESTPQSHNAPGWGPFGADHDDAAAKEEDEAATPSAEQVSPQRPPAASRRKNLEFEPLSTTALILEDRPSNLPAKSEEETQRHKLEYEEMVAGAKRRELKDAQKKKRQMKERHRHEDNISHAMVVWNTHILPHWDTMKSTRRVRDLWWQGVPPSVRGRVWSLAIGNELNITAELYDIFLCRAKEKWRSYSETSSVNNDSENDGGASLADRESSLDLIKLDISRTFPSLFIFQKGGPYHDVLHSVLGAYTCYRPDIGYVQGMSFIAAVLILNMEEADAFVTFANLLNKPCQMAFFRVDHHLMLKYFAVFEVFFQENLPRLFHHFTINKLTPDLYLIDWIFTLYSKSLPLDVACRVWDVFCRDGEEGLFRTGLGILRLFQEVLLQMDFIHMAQFLSRLPEDLPAHALFAAMAATHMISRNRRWAQVFASLAKDQNKEADKSGSPALSS
ncbi:TBC1 domain family member 12-like isoform X2 [Stigmatopora nigra]